MIDHAQLCRAVREQRLPLTRHVQPSRETWGEAILLVRVVAVHAMAMLGVLWAAGAL